MSYYPELDNHAKKDFIALKAKVEKLDINGLVKVPTGLNDLQTKVDNLDVGKLKTASADLKKLGDVQSKNVIKKSVYNTLNTKVNKSEKKFLMLLL